MGIAYVVLAAFEVLLGVTGRSLSSNGREWFAFAGLHNAIHWLVALVFLSSLYFGRYPAKMTAWTVGAVYAVLTLLALFARAWLGRVLGHDGALPWGYVVSMGLTTLLALMVGYGSEAKPGMTRRNLRRARGT